MHVSWPIRIAYQLAKAGADTEGGLLSKQFIPDIETPAAEIFQADEVRRLKLAILSNANLTGSRDDALEFV